MAKYKAYPEYKDSGVEWLGEVPVHWGSRPLKYLCTCNDQVISDSTDRDYELEYVDIGSVSSSQGITKTENIAFSKAPSRARRLVQDGDVIISTVRTYLEAIAPIINPPANMIVSTGFAVIRPLSNLDKGFAAYCLRASGFIKEVVARSVGVSYPAINASDLISIPTPSCSLFEQSKIAAFLDHETAKIDNLIEKQQQLIELLKEKRQAVISHAVTKGLNPDVPMKDSGVEWLGEVPEHWEMKRLAYLGSARNGLTYSPENITDQESGVLVLRSSNIQNSNLCFDDNVYVNTNIPEQFLVKENDLLICSRNGSRNLIGKNALINKEAEGMAFGAFMAIFRSQINSYIFWVLNSPLFDYQSGSFLTSTINQLTIGNLNSMEVPVPPLKEQKEIELYLFKKNNDFIELINRVNNSITLLQERRTAVISAAVTGKIDVRDWVAPNACEAEVSQEVTA